MRLKEARRMRRTIVIEDNLLIDAQRLLGTNGVRDTVDKALREVIRKNRLEQLRKSLGKMDLGQTSEELTMLRDTE
jgi:Arc/MetJ family transcription regulator